MPPQLPPENLVINSLIDEADAFLARFRTQHSGLEWRQKILLLVDLHASVKNMAKCANPTIAAKVAARERLRYISWSPTR